MKRRYVYETMLTYWIVGEDILIKLKKNPKIPRSEFALYLLNSQILEIMRDEINSILSEYAYYYPYN